MQTLQDGFLRPDASHLQDRARLRTGLTLLREDKEVTGRRSHAKTPPELAVAQLDPSPLASPFTKHREPLMGLRPRASHLLEHSQEITGLRPLVNQRTQYFRLLTEQRKQWEVQVYLKPLA